MTTELASECGLAPFISRFAMALPSRPAASLRYDAARQVGEIHTSNAWMDTLSAQAQCATLLTKVANEATDDD